jgi:histidinol phosphatase-like enzyme
MVIIKPTKDATYKNTVDMLDEMTIDQVNRYALVDLTPDEYKYVLATEQANGIK